MSLCLCGAGINFLAAVCVGRLPPLLPGARSPVAGVWRAGAAPSVGVRWLVLVGLQLSVHCFGVAVCCGALCCVVPCFAVLRRAGPCCVAVRPAGSRRVALCPALVCRSVPRGVASCCGVLCLRVRCRGALHSSVLRCGVPFSLVLCRGGSVDVSPARVVGRSAGRSVAAWWPADAVRCGVARLVCAVGVWVCRSSWWVG